jgi:hypothetical protein
MSIGYSQWFTLSVQASAKEAFARMMKGESELFLYYRPHGLEFKVLACDENAEGLELVFRQKIPTNLTLDQLCMMFARDCARVPVLPAG